jgi:uncharacterized RDD family membrane protein YckC
MSLEHLMDKIYIVKPHPAPAGAELRHHYAKWISPRPKDIRVDRTFDLPYANINFIAAYARGEFDTGERFIDLGIVGFPMIVRAPFAALSANEFRFPSRNIDQNIRHVITELITNGRIVAMSEETYRFLHGRQIHCLEASGVQGYITSFFAMVRDKVPIRCDGCKKFIWIETGKLPVNPVRTKCPSCSHQFQVQRPPEIDIQLSRFLSTTGTHIRAKEGDLLLGATGEFKPKDRPAGVAEPSGLDLDLDGILGPTAPPAAPAAPPATPAAPPAAPPPAEDDALAAIIGPAAAKPGDGPAIELDDDFLKEITPDKAAVAKAAEPQGPAVLDNNPVSSVVDVLNSADIIADVFQTKPPAAVVCPSCGTEVGFEKVCPNCFMELMPADAGFGELEAPVDSPIEIRLKDLPDDKPATPPPPAERAASQAGPVPARGAAADEKAEGPADGITSVWDDKVWTVKIGDELYENLDMRTIEDWILGGNVLATDLIRKGEAKWTELGSVPYFRNAFKTAKDRVRMGGSDALMSFQPAAPLKRIIAAVIDLVITWLLSLLGMIALGMSAGGSEGLFALLMGVAGAVLLPFMYLAFTNGVLGRSIGKRLLNLAVIDKKGNPIGLGKGLLRTIVWGFVIGWFFALSSSTHQTLHDRVVDSYVIQLE